MQFGAVDEGIELGPVGGGIEIDQSKAVEHRARVGDGIEASPLVFVLAVGIADAVDVGIGTPGGAGIVLVPAAAHPVHQPVVEIIGAVGEEDVPVLIGEGDGESDRVRLLDGHSGAAHALNRHIAHHPGVGEEAVVDPEPPPPAAFEGKLNDAVEGAVVEADVVAVIGPLLHQHIAHIGEGAVFEGDIVGVIAGDVVRKGDRPAVVHKVGIDAVAEVAVFEGAVEMLAAHADRSGGGGRRAGHIVEDAAFEIAKLAGVAGDAGGITVKNDRRAGLHAGGIRKADPDILHDQVTIDRDDKVFGDAAAGRPENLRRRGVLGCAGRRGDEFEGLSDRHFDLAGQDVPVVRIQFEDLAVEGTGIDGILDHRIELALTSPAVETFDVGGILLLRKQGYRQKHRTDQKHYQTSHNPLLHVDNYWLIA